MSTTESTDTKRISLRAIQPGQLLVHIEGKQLRGKRGGRYEFRFVAIGGRFTHSALNADGTQRTFYFENVSPVTISNQLSSLLVAKVRS